MRIEHQRDRGRQASIDILVDPRLPERGGEVLGRSASPARPRRARSAITGSTTSTTELIEPSVPIAFAKTHGVLAARATLPSPARGRIALSDPYDTACLDDLRLLFDGAEIETELAPQTRSVHGRHQPGLRPRRHRLDDDPRETPRTISRRWPARSRRRAPGPARRRRRRADHPAGRLAAAAGRQGARERYPHRAVREGDPRALPFVDNMLYEPVSAAAEGAAALDRVAHQDPGRARHRREAHPPGRRIRSQDRGPRLRRALLDGAGRPRRAAGAAPAAAHDRDARPRAPRFLRANSSTSGRS